MEDRQGNTTASAHKKSKKRKKHKPKKSGTQVSSPELISVEPSESVNEECGQLSVCLEKKSAENHLSDLNLQTELASNANAASSSISNEKKELVAETELASPVDTVSSRKNKSWLHSCRKENSLNRAVEENHSNSLTENSTGDQERHLRSEDCVDSGPINQTIQPSARRETDLGKGNITKDKDNSVQREIVGDTVQNKQKDCSSTMPENTAESSQKTKAQLKAERKAAFEAQHRDQELQKPKAATKAERRALQEAQRAKKAPTEKTDGKIDVKSSLPVTSGAVVNRGSKVLDVSNESKTEKSRSSESPKKIIEKKLISGKGTSGQRKARLFFHLPQYQWDEDLTADSMTIGAIHPAVLRIGLQIAQGLITGANARTVAMMLAFKQVIKDYITPPHKELSRDLEAKLQPFISFLNKCRPLSAGMENEVKKLKWEINHIPTDTSDAEAKMMLCEAIDTNVKNDITLAKTAICLSICSKISHDDVILTYSCSSVVKGVLAYAYSAGKKFQVIVVDSRPRLEGREMVRYLVKLGIPCSYVLINAVSYVIKEVTKVILGAHSLQANGYVMSRVGSSQIALIARASNVPVLVCCETYKFSERVHTDSFVYNELGNPNDLVTTTPNHKCSLENWKEIPSLRLLNLAYDVTPPNLVTAVITDLGMLPCTSVPVVLRVKHFAGREQ